MEVKHKVNLAKTTATAKAKVSGEHVAITRSGHRGSEWERDWTTWTTIDATVGTTSALMITILAKTISSYGTSLVGNLGDVTMMCERGGRERTTRTNDRQRRMHVSGGPLRTQDGQSS